MFMILDGLDKRYHVLKGSVELPYSGRIVDLYTMFTNNEASFMERIYRI